MSGSTRFAMTLPFLVLGVACGGKSPLDIGRDKPKPSKKWEEPKLHKQDERPQEPWQPIPDEEDKQDEEQPGADPEGGAAGKARPR